MIRRIVKIDSEKCTGCGACAAACHEGAIVMVDGTAQLLRDDYCDGLGDCLPACPAGAISFEEREAAAYDHEAVQENMRKTGRIMPKGGCQGSRVVSIRRADTAVQAAGESALRNWPVQMKLAPVSAEYFNGAELLIAADCAAYAYGDFHGRFIKNRVCLIGCTKLDNANYAEKLSEIIRHNDIKGVTVVRMEVPCCGGLDRAVRSAVEDSGKQIIVETVVVSAKGETIM